MQMPVNETLEILALLQAWEESYPEERFPPGSVSREGIAGCAIRQALQKIRSEIYAGKHHAIIEVDGKPQAMGDLLEQRDRVQAVTDEMRERGEL